MFRICWSILIGFLILALPGCQGLSSDQVERLDQVFENYASMDPDDLPPPGHSHYIEATPPLVLISPAARNEKSTKMHRWHPEIREDLRAEAFSDAKTYLFCFNQDDKTKVVVAMDVETGDFRGRREVAATKKHVMDLIQKAVSDDSEWRYGFYQSRLNAWDQEYGGMILEGLPDKKLGRVQAPVVLINSAVLNSEVEKASLHDDTNQVRRDLGENMAAVGEEWNTIFLFRIERERRTKTTYMDGGTAWVEVGTVFAFSKSGVFLGSAEVEGTAPGVKTMGKKAVGKIHARRVLPNSLGIVRKKSRKWH